MAAKTTKKAAPKKAAKKPTTKKATAKRTPRAKTSTQAKATTKTNAAPAKATSAKTDATPKAAKPPRERDPRLPRPGTILRRTYQGKEHEVQVLDAGFLHDGKTWRSLSGIAKAITGTAWNGYTFWGTQRRVPKTPAETTELK